MSQPMSSSNNENLIRQDAPRDKEQASTSYASGAEVLANEERERRRNEQSQALEDAGDPRLTEQRSEMEGMGGAGGGDLDDVGDVGYPEEAGGGPVSRQQRDFVDRAPGVRLEGMGGAGGGDLDDIGDVGNPDGTIERVAPGRGPAGDADGDRFAQAWRMAGGEGGDVETARTMGSGSFDTAPDMDMPTTDAIDGGIGADGPDVGAPWDRVDDAARLGRNPKPRL